MKLVFMGTPEFAVPCLRALVGADYHVSGVFTQPDKPKGRGYAMTPPPVKQAAVEYGIPVYQPAGMRDGVALSVLEELAPDLIVVVAYGKILPEDILSLPRYGCINVHASLLPKYRGAAPIQWAVLNGEQETGVTTMQMKKGIDTGDMLCRISTPIDPDETAGGLHDRLSVLGAEVLLQTLDALEKQALTPEKQEDAASCYAPMLDKSLCPIDFTQTAQLVHDKVRGLSPWPVAFTQLNGKVLKIHRTKISGEISGNPGEIVCCDGCLLVACGDGRAVELLTVQAEGGKKMASVDFLRGHPLKRGTLLG